MKLFYEGRNRNLEIAVKIANEILSMEKFYNEIVSLKKFDNTIPEDLDSAVIADLLKNHPKKVFVKTYFAPQGANAKTRRANYFRMNTANLRRPKSEVIRTLIHEYVHCIDFFSTEYKFTHKDNDNSKGDKDNTAPWKIGEIAQNIAKEILK